MLNTAHRELVTISRMMVACQKKYVVITDADADAEGDSTPPIPEPYLEQLGVISAADLAEAEGDADVFYQVREKSPVQSGSVGCVDVCCRSLRFDVLLPS